MAKPLSTFEAVENPAYEGVLGVVGVIEHLLQSDVLRGTHRGRDRSSDSVYLLNTFEREKKPQPALLSFSSFIFSSSLTPHD
jgi:hypothetical protein